MPQNLTLGAQNFLDYGSKFSLTYNCMSRKNNKTAVILTF